ncbi:PQQ-binding-like beta-propeller repeat protein [Streptomyces sp. NBC_01142]|uniref:outer membrane protein assembly factor BamB family protein n=1 Tax=Streptomyces sp. NBC_01142 TaxID=2975865 RepID=UPI002252E80E|nr:PQQ-binding-like beta-propeller repeat protein [Streptomyces sp. NBC_01142]MCX4822816.1 PQQ-binding-like beta-propeller repeat protein [Streptomyces sp. NBC_01142]
MRNARGCRRRVGLRGIWAITALTVLAACTIGGEKQVKERVTEASGTYPNRVERPTAGFQVALPSRPLVVDRRLRVMTAAGKVWAEALEAPEKAPVFWSYEREEELNKVAVVDRGKGDPLVVSLWYDGALIAVNARTGAVAWRAEDSDYIGDRWSAFETVATYGSLRLVPGPRPVVVAHGIGKSGVVAFDAATGDKLWNRPWKGCDTSGTAWTATHAVVVDEDCES